MYAVHLNSSQLEQKEAQLYYRSFPSSVAARSRIMLKTIINKAIKAVLDELFIDAPSVNLSMGADLFSDSKINLSNLRFRPDIFDISLQPFSLVAGHVGSVNVEGIAELALGGNLRFQAENVFLLFRLDSLADPEKVQTMKKILLELQSGKFSAMLLSDMLRKLQGLSLPPDSDIKEKRKVIYKTFDSLSKNLHLTMKSIHVRFEFADEDNLLHNKVNSLGVMIPVVKIGHNVSASLRPEGLNKNDPAWLLSIKGLQAYVDYNRFSYESTEDFEKTVDNFKTQWRSEVHTVVLSPLDMDIVFGVTIKRNSGLICPHIKVQIPTLKFSIDEKQMHVLQDIVLQFAKAQKKYQQRVKIQKIFRKGFPLPKMYEIGGIRFLPHLMLRGQPYPSKSDIPIGYTPERTKDNNDLQGNGLIAFMKDRVGNQWKIMMWKFAIRSVMHDLQKTRPLGRWVELIRLLYIRKDYAFTYAKLLKRSSDTGNFVFNVNANTISANAMRQLFEYEMMLSDSAVHMFRTVAYLLAMVGHQHMKRTQFSTGTATTNASASNGNNRHSLGNTTHSNAISGHNTIHNQRHSVNIHNTSSNSLKTNTVSSVLWESLSITWVDVLRMYIILYETQRESAFHRFDRSNQDNDDLEDYYSMAGTTAGSHNTRDTDDDVSVRSQIATSDHGDNTVTTAQKRPTKTGSSWVSMFSSWTTSSSSSSNSTDDEYDKKVMKSFDLSVFGDALSGLVEKVDRVRGVDGTDGVALFSSGVEQLLKNNVLLPHTRHPAMDRIEEAVQWAINKHKSPVTIMPPDFSSKIDKCVYEVKTPSTLHQKERVPLIHASCEGVLFTVNISQSTNNNSNNNKNQVGNSMSTSNNNRKEVRGFSSLTGALVQFRLVVKQFSFALAVPVTPSIITNNSINNGAEPAPSLPPTAATATPLLPTQEQDEDNSDSETSSITTSTIATSNTNNNTTNANNAGIVRTPDAKMRPSSSFRTATAVTTAATAAGTAVDALGTPPRTSVNPNMHHRGPYTIHSPIDDTLGVIATSKPNTLNHNGHNKRELREVISSAPGENIFVFCVILDLDDKGEGAGDIQLQLGGMRMDFSRRTMTALFDPLLTSTGDHLSESYRAFSALLPFTSAMEHSLLMDWQEKLPYVMLACDPPVSVLTRLALQTDAKRLRQHTEEINNNQISHKSQRTGGMTSKKSSSSLSSSGKRDIPAPNDTASVSSRDKKTKLPAELKTVMIDDISRIDHEFEHQNMSFLLDRSQLGNNNNNASFTLSDDEHHKEEEDEEDKLLLGAMATEQEGDPLQPLVDVEDVSDDEHNETYDRDRNESFFLDENDGENDDDNNGLTWEERRQRRIAMVFNKNWMHWLGTMEACLPRVVSVCLRTSPIVLQSLEAMVIRDLVYAKMHAVLDQAAQRHQQYTQAGVLDAVSVWGILGHLLQLATWTETNNVTMLQQQQQQQTRLRAYSTSLAGVRKWGSKRPAGSGRGGNTGLVRPTHAPSFASTLPPATSLSSFKIKALIPAVEVVLAKALYPYPALDVHVQGMAVLKIPMSDETLCHYLAWLLAEYCPVHTL